MEAKHTPGPWETAANGQGQWDVCGPDAGDMIADLAYCENAEANARLIAAAPDLLAAAERVIMDVDRGFSDPEHDDDGALDALRTAVANARGGE